MEHEASGSARPPFSWVRLGSGGANAEADAREEALELSRALAAQTIALERDAVVEEFPDRLRAIAETVWPASPRSGYGLHSSFGAYLVTKVAVEWAPSAHVGLRHEPLGPEGLLEDLAEHGVDRGLGLTVLGDWKGVERGFVADPRGLDTSRIAGLAECSLTRLERARALSQVAYSARCLARLASAVSFLSTVRKVLTVLAPGALGDEFVAAMVAIHLGLPERALEIVGREPDGLAQRTIAELALAEIALSRGERPSFSDDGPLLLPDIESERGGSLADPMDGARVSGDSGEAEDDVLEIIEERSARPSPYIVDPPDGVPPPWAPSLARWPSSPGGVSSGAGDPSMLADWRDRYLAALGLISRHRSLLGLRLPAVPHTALPFRIPPDERLIGGPPLGALFPPVRGALRAIARAAEGEGPSDRALAEAGDLSWALVRARALAAIASGDVERAIQAADDLPEGASPEGLWAKDLLRRFGGRRHFAPEPGEVRAAASRLVADLARQLGQTVAGTLAPNSRSSILS